MSTKLSLEEVKNRIKKVHGDNIELLNYTSYDNDASFQCKKYGHVWDTNPYVVWNGCGCPECNKLNASKRNLISYEEIKQRIEDEHCQIITTKEKYKNTLENIEIQFPCGHIGTLPYYSFKRGQRCKVCSQEKNNMSKIKPEKIMKILEENNFKFLCFPEGYKNKHSRIEYICNEGHINNYKISSLMTHPNCNTCSKLRRIGKNHSSWRGGDQSLSRFLKGKPIKEWKKESIRLSNFKCIITGDKFDDVHHLYSFDLILKETLIELNLNIRNSLGEYSQEEIIDLKNKIIEIHERYPYGVCLCRRVHKLFHILYGTGGTTPEQFYEFKQKVLSGEIVID